MLRQSAIVLAFLLLPTAPVAGEPPQRVAVLNWDLAQTLIALGVEPVAVANRSGYRKWVADPPLPDATADVGRRIEPDLDVLTGLRPDLILITGYYNRAGDRLQTIAETEKLPIYQPEGEALPRSLTVARELAERLDREAAMERLQGRLKEALDDLRARTEAGDSVYVVRFRDGGNVQVYGAGGLFDGVLGRAGLVNAWDGPSNYWGFAMTPLERLDRPADHLVVIEPVPRRAQEMMANSPIWQALPAVREGRVHRLAPIWSFGGVPSAIRFADRLGAAIDAPD